MRKYTLKVSIHAPARGATYPIILSLIASTPFQSTHPRGVRQFDIDILISFFWCFNPRTREGCDSALARYFSHILSFNPRTREGCDQKGPGKSLAS